MHIEAEGNEGEEQQEGLQLLNVSMLQGDALPDNRAYLDGCSTVTAFKAGKYLEGIKTVQNGIKINCNAGAVTTNKLGSFGSLNVWYIPNGIANIFSMHELEDHIRQLGRVLSSAHAKGNGEVPQGRTRPTIYRP